MNETTETMTAALESKIGAFLRKLLKLGDDVPLDAEADLVQQIGLDSIEAFDAVASFHELLNLPIPDDFNPRTANSIHNLSNYLMDRFGPDAAERFLDLDLDKVTLGDDQEDL
jgi:acyl carrier protein